MEAVIFMGIQASGKTTFYCRKFFRSHLRINLDMLKTRHREKLLLDACIRMKQSFVVDNTNPTREDRRRYLEPAGGSGFKVTGYYFSSVLSECLERNRNRAEDERIPEAGIRGISSEMELPDQSEGFDELYYVKVNQEGRFEVTPWKQEE